MNVKKLTSVIAVSALLGSMALTSSAAAVSPSERTSYSGPHASANELLPLETPLPDQALDQVAGDGLLGAVVGGLQGASIGAAAYSASVVYHGFVHHDWSWQWDSFNEAVFVGGVGGFVGGLFTPTP